MNFTIGRYVINLDLSRDGDKFTGSTRIECTGHLDTLQLDAKGLEIDSVSVDSKKRKYSTDTISHKLNISGPFDGKNEILIAFKGKISYGLHGIYHAGHGKEGMLSTDLEPNSAREIIPCIDNPSFKAAFALRVRIKSDEEAISNMPIKSEEVSGGTKEVEFFDTPKMSTYLLYLGVGKFTSRSKRYRDIEVILTAPRNKLNSDDYPIDTAIKCLEFFEKYFGMKYELPKLHLIAVPEFAEGAMENWGAITFREDSLLTNDSTDAASRLWIASTIVHEIAHQWFGDLVTMKWWNDLWLNESFATFMSYLSIDSIYPNYEIWKMFYTHEETWALAEDSLKSSHPIAVEVKEPREIQQIFDGVSYGKGGSILRMMEMFVGGNNFREGTSRYLSDFRYSNAEGIHFWDHIERASKQPIVRTALEWITKQGYPAIYVEKSGNDLRLRQERFLLDGTKSKELWPIPVVIKRMGSTERVLMESREITIPADNFSKLNWDGSGFFITKYSDDYYYNLEKYLSGYSSIDAAELAHDAFQFLLRREISIETYLTALEKLSNIPVTPLANVISIQFELLLQLIPKNKDFRPRAVILLRKLNSILGEKKEGEGPDVTSARMAVRVLLARLDIDFARELSKQFDVFFRLDPDDRRVVSVAHSNFTSNIDEYRELYRKAELDEDKDKLLQGMALVSGLKNSEILFNMIVKEEIKKQDSISAFAFMSRNTEARKFVFDKLEEFISRVRQVFEGSGIASRVIQTEVPTIGVDNVDKMRLLLDRIDAPDLNRGIQKGMELLEVYQQFRDRFN